MPLIRHFSKALVLSAFLSLPSAVAAQDSALRIVAEPEAVTLQVGEALPIAVRVVDSNGETVALDLRFAAPRNVLRFRDGVLQAYRAGDFEIVATAVMPAGAEGAPALLRLPITVTWPAVERVDVNASGARLYVGTTLTHNPVAFHADGTPRPDLIVNWSTSNVNVATVDRYGTVVATSTGAVTISASIDGSVASTTAYDVVDFPANQLTIRGGADAARTGDVLRFEAVGTAPLGVIEGLPMTWAYTFVPDDSINAPGASAIVEDGAFVAEVPGRYTVLALSGPLTARHTVLVKGRDVIQEVELQGRGSVVNQHTSDLWVFEGVDGRDYAITGTWSADGWAYFWDVTNPTRIVKTDSLQIDARTVNDVKVAPNGRYAALSREGASNRRNGVVILDMADPSHPTIASIFDTHGVTGGVHNMFASDDYLFAIANGDKYVIIDVRDPYDPKFVSEYNHPNSRIHDVWVHDGIAYSSEWQTGVVVVDVGNGRWGGSIENPVFVTNVPYPVGATHAAFPYYQESTGKFYLFLGDEISGGSGRSWAGAGTDNQPYDPETGEGGVQGRMDGYLHVIDFTDSENPKDVARYEVPGAGAHNIWVEHDMLYQAYYKGGLRVVDVSGELMGNLGHQGREVAVYKSQDPDGYYKNQVSVFGPQPYKGHVFFSDMNSGLWAVKLRPRSRPIS